jgi:hypothetical protein
MPHEHRAVRAFTLINEREITGSARVQRVRDKIPTTAAWQHTNRPGGTTDRVERETNMLRNTILALAAVTAIGVTILPATDASAYGYRGWHHRHWNHGWHRHYGWGHHRHYGWYHRWHWRG